MRSAIANSVYEIPEWCLLNWCLRPCLFGDEANLRPECVYTTNITSLTSFFIACHAMHLPYYIFYIIITVLWHGRPLYHPSLASTRSVTYCEWTVQTVRVYRRCRPCSADAVGDSDEYWNDTKELNRTISSSIFESRVYHELLIHRQQ